MISVNEARAILSGHLYRAASLELPLVESHALVISEATVARADVPPFDNSSMDGYAFSFEGYKNRMKITAVAQAGSVLPQALKSGEAARIFTGAALPEGADTVVMQEVCKLVEGELEFDISGISRGAFVRYRGSQNRIGDAIAGPGDIVSPALIGLAASAGLGKINVYRRPSIGLVITGNELLEAGSKPEPGKIFDANGPMLEACLKQDLVQDIRRYCVSDNLQMLLDTISMAIEKHDMLIFSGGISVGDHDYVHEALSRSGANKLFHRISQKPGKPFYAGLLAGKWVFALPGNPASVFTCYQMYVRQCIRFFMGFSAGLEAPLMLPLKNEWEKKGGLTHFLKARYMHGEVEILQGQDSFNLLPLAHANCLVELDEETSVVPIGTPVKVHPC